MAASGDEQIFLNYRRDETAAEALRVAGSLAEAFGAGTVFVDVESTEAGEAFPGELEFALQRSAVVVAIIGPGWAGELARRAKDPSRIDYLSYELQRARKSGIPILPVTVGGAKMPERDALPQGLEFMSTLHALPLTGESPATFNALCDAIARRTRLKRQGTSRGIAKRSLAALLAAPASFLLHPRRFLILNSRGTIADFALLAVLSLVVNVFVALILGAATGIAPASLVAFVLPVSIGLTVLSLVVGGFFAIVLYAALKVLGGRGRFARFLLVVELMRMFAASVFAICISVMFYIGPLVDDGFATWKGEVDRAGDIDGYYDVLKVLPTYISAGTASVMKGVLWGVAIGVLTWAWFAWRSVRIIHELTPARALLLLGAWIFLETVTLLLPA